MLRSLVTAGNVCACNVWLFCVPCPCFIGLISCKTHKSYWISVEKIYWQFWHQLLEFVRGTKDTWPHLWLWQWNPPLDSCYKNCHEMPSEVHYRAQEMHCWLGSWWKGLVSPSKNPTAFGLIASGLAQLAGPPLCKVSLRPRRGHSCLLGCTCRRKIVTFRVSNRVLIFLPRHVSRDGVTWLVHNINTNTHV